MRPSRLSVALVLALAALILPAAPLFSQGEESVLLRGPRPGRGIELLSTNALAHERAVYSYRGGEVRVYHIPRYQPPPRGWVREDCGRIGLLRPPQEPGSGEEGKERSFLYDSGEDWQLIFVFPSQEENCPFIEAFLGRFRTFLGMKVSPFPASFKLN